MCRLFGMNAGTNRVHLRYWLSQAPDSIATQSHRNPDGTGIGWYDREGHPQLRREPHPAAESRGFGIRARQIDTNTVITHIRAATTGSDSELNCHPFLIHGRMMAHNGGFGDLERVNKQLGDYADLVRGQTDSERYAALIAQQADLAGGDVGMGIANAAAWLAANVPLYSLNTIVVGNGELWALRYPATRALHIARRELAGPQGAPTADPLADPDYQGHSGQAAVELAGQSQVVPVVIVASERIDGSPDWRMLSPGELVHVSADLSFTSRIVLSQPPAHYVEPSEADPNVDTF